MDRRISQAVIDPWPQDDRPVIRVNWLRVALAGLVAATVTILVTILLTLRFQATSERTLQTASGGPSAATEVSSAPKPDSSSSWTLQPDGTLVERRSVRRQTTDPELAIEKSMKTKRLLSKAQNLLAQGDISAARLSLRWAAEAGNARAALLLGETYEGCFHYVGPLRCGEGADRPTARHWYEMAAKLGSADARQRVDRLASEEPGYDLLSRR
jgi:hypothetical protein